MDPSFINRILYQLTHVEELLAIYNQFATEAQSDWFHVTGKQLVHEYHGSQAQSTERGTRAGGVDSTNTWEETSNPVFEVESVSPQNVLQMTGIQNEPLIPIYKFQRAGLLKAAEELQDRIDLLDPKVHSNEAVIQKSSQANFTSVDLLPHTCDVRRLFVDLAQSFVIAHAQLAVYPEVQASAPPLCCIF